MIELNNTTKSKIPSKTIIATAEKFLAVKKLSKKDVSIAIIGDRRMRELNLIYRKTDKTTDVLSFAGEGDFFGEIILCLNQIKRQAKVSGRTFKYELIFILIHGLLHLYGLEDHTEKERLCMIGLGEDLIKKLCLV